MARTRITYHQDGSKTVHTGKVLSGEYEAKNFHENINRTYYELECSGQLKNMNAREKQRTRDLHILAQDPRYWN